MTSTERHEPTIADLLARIECLQREVSQQRTVTHQLMAQQQQNTMGAPEAQTPRASVTSTRTRLEGMLRVTFGRRTRRLGAGIGLASLLLVAPWQSDVSLANPTGNTAYGANALITNAGNDNSAFGDSALFSNTGGGYNTATGYAALKNNTDGSLNTALGLQALFTSTSGYSNTATGFDALFYDTTGNYNAAYGANALLLTTRGSNNTAIGDNAGESPNAATPNTTGSNNTFIGYSSGPGTSSEINNATAIGANAVVAQSNSIVLGGIGDNTQRVGVGTATPHSALQIAKGYLQLRPISGAPPPATTCATADDYGRMVMRTDGTTNLYVCVEGGWLGK